MKGENYHMKINNKSKRIISTTMALVILGSNGAFAKSEIRKEETVYVNLDPNGNIVSNISSIWINSEEDLVNIEDISSLKNIENIKGDEKPEEKDGRLIWNVAGKDLYYQGESEGELPVDIRIKYFLDGKEVKPEEIQGQSGKFRLEILLENKEDVRVNIKGREEVIYTPYLLGTVVDLPNESFKNIRNNSGKVLSDGNNEIITFLSIPGLEESLDMKFENIDMTNRLIVEADVENFYMKPIVFTMTPEIPEIKELDKAKDLEELTQGLEKITDASLQLTDATDLVVEGQEALDTGIGEFLEGLHVLDLGTGKLLDGSRALEDGLKETHKGAEELKAGSKGLTDGAKELGQGYRALGEGAIEFSEKSLEFSQGALEVSKGVASIPENTSKMSAGMDGIIQGTERVRQGQKNLSLGIDSSIEGINKLLAGTQREAKGISALIKSMEVLEGGAGMVGKLPGGEELGDKLTSGIRDHKEGLVELNNSKSEMIRGLEDLEKALESIKMGNEELTKGLDEVNSGQVEVKAGLDTLAAGTGQLKDASSKLLEGSNGLNQGAELIQDRSKKLSQGSEDFAKGGESLEVGIDKLSGGLLELSKGSGGISQAIMELNQGASKLSQAGGQLKDGSGHLLSGVHELNDGMHKFNDEGISKIAEAEDMADLDINKILDRKDALIDLSKSKASYSGVSEDMTSSVKYIIKTQGLDKEKLQIEFEDVQVEEEAGFRTWVKNLLNKVE